VHGWAIGSIVGVSIRRAGRLPRFADVIHGRTATSSPSTARPDPSARTIGGPITTAEGKAPVLAGALGRE
jgi:hypothetical protein